MGNACIDRPRSEAEDNEINPHQLTLLDNNVYGPFVGDVDDKSALFIIRIPNKKKVDHIVKEMNDNKEDNNELVKIDCIMEPNIDNDYVGRYKINNLQSNAKYELTCNNDGKEYKCCFKTLPDQSAKKLTFVFSSCLGGQGFGRRVGKTWKIFDSMKERDADFFLFLGDTIYADDVISVDGNEFVKEKMVAGAEKVCKNDDELFARYRYHLGDNSYMNYLQSTATFAIWDDHEVADDWGMKKQREITPEYVKDCSKAFTTYWPINIGDYDANVPELPGKLYRNFAVGNLCEFFILDCRSCRSAHSINLEEKMAKTPPGVERSKSHGRPQMTTMLGEDQLEWLINSLSASTVKWKFVVSSVPIGFDTGSRPDPTVIGRDGWSDRGARKELGQLLTKLYEKGTAKNLVFITADVHFPSATRYKPKFDKDTHEFIPTNDVAIVKDDSKLIDGPVFHEFGAGPLDALCLPPTKPNKAFSPEVLFQEGSLNADLHNFGHVTVEEGCIIYEVVTKNNESIFKFELPFNDETYEENN